ncbi:MAG: 16S rRNA (adenine(1518)-N(6)/adenine(1519)-N(6))-dimethyltransferase RsmA [Treponema sp.]
MDKINLKSIDYNSPAALKNFMESHGMAMQKKFGQNFLINADARKTLAEELTVTPDMKVWEVGPGLGAMTSEILLRGAELTVFEIDRGFASVLKELFSSYGNNFKIVEGDVIKTWKNELQTGGFPERIFGNLPYNIAASIIADTIESGVRFEKAVFTVQKEVADRMCAKEGSSDYSSFSILCRWAYNVKPLLELSGGNFWPRPNVASKSVLMEKNPDFPNCINPAHFVKMQRALFGLRRKTVYNNLLRFTSDADKALSALKKSGIDPMDRAERLSIKKLLELSDNLNTAIL